MMCKHVKIHASFNIIVKNHRQVFAKSRSYNGVHFFFSLVIRRKSSSRTFQKSSLYLCTYSNFFHVEICIFPNEGEHENNFFFNIQEFKKG